MSEYQYYEFQALDRPLDEADRRALRAISSRARITATSFTNSYDWGDFKGQPAELMARWFDLHLYLANWGAREFMMRLPAHLVDRPRLKALLRGKDAARLTAAGDNLILTITQQEEPEDDWDDGSGWLTELAPLRDELLSGDLRLFYLLWLMAVQWEEVPDDDPEPLPGLAPMTDALTAFAEFFRIDDSLVAAAAERQACSADPVSAEAARGLIDRLPANDKIDLLLRLFNGDPHVGAQLRRRVQAQMDSAPADRATPRTAAMLRTRAAEIRHEHERIAAANEEAERQKREAAAARARRARLNAMIGREEQVWDEVEAEIQRRNAPGYERAAALLADLSALADEEGETDAFIQRLDHLRTRHSGKYKLIERLKFHDPAA